MYLGVGLCGIPLFGSHSLLSERTYVGSIVPGMWDSDSPGCGFQDNRQWDLLFTIVHSAIVLYILLLFSE